jgi:ATP-dependent protease HslVU (ClpYQ) peptidase subunit
MTLILAVACSDGVVLSGDSASSDFEIGTKQPYRKIRSVGNLPIVWGGSGSSGLLQHVETALNSLTAFKATPHKTRQEIKKLIFPVLKESKDLHVTYPQYGFDKPPIAILLICFIQDSKPWILEIERDCQDTMYGEDLGNFAAIGSGKPWAQAFFRPHLNTKRDLRLGKIFSYRVLEDSINLASGGLAFPVHMSYISSSGETSSADTSELSGISKTCELWRELERDAVGKLLSPSNEIGCAGEIPLPPTQ